MDIEWKSSRTFTPNWCDKLVDNLEKAFSNINESFKEMKTDIREIKETLLDKIDNALSVANEAKSMVETHVTALNSLCEDVNELKKTCTVLKKENTLLKQHNLNNEMYSRKDNLILYGIIERDNENNIHCAQAARVFFREKLHLDDEQVAGISFVRCHRLKERRFGVRPIIVRFWRYSDRELVWGKVTELKGQRILSMSEDFPREIAYRRNKLYPIYKKAKQTPNLCNKVFLRGDKLIIVGKQYTVDNIHTLTGSLNPRSFSERTNENVYVMGGIHSDSSPLSNYAKCPRAFKYMGKSFTTSEAAYMYAKAINADQATIADEIQLAPDAASANKLGREIVIGKDQWRNQRDQIMTEVLTEKFSQIPEMAAELKATGRKTIGEAGTHPYWSAGVTINDPHILDTSKWKYQNKLGVILGGIRDSI